jgi:hypothetical protein
MKKIMLIPLLALSGCASVATDAVLTHEGSPQGELLVYRESAFLAGGVGLYVGESDKYFFVLDNSEYAKVKIDAGEYVFQAKAHASPASELRVTVKPDQLTCLKGKPNSAVAAAMMIPIVGNTVSSFVLEQVECPVNGVPAGYTLAQE